MNGFASLYIMKTKYDTKVEYIEDNGNDSRSSMIVAMATVLSTIFLFDMYALIISLVAWRIMYCIKVMIF